MAKQIIFHIEKILNQRSLSCVLSGVPNSSSSLDTVEKLEMTPERKAKLEALKSRPRRRPDWAEMMKEVEDGIKLRHVQCNDRSKPLLPQVKAKGQVCTRLRLPPPLEVIRWQFYAQTG
jgi:hypothetical protein